MALCSQCGMNEPLPMDPDDLCKSCAEEAEWNLYVIEESTPHKRDMWCQGCGNHIHVEPHEVLRMCDQCGARWWAHYMPDRRKMQIVRQAEVR